MKTLYIQIEFDNSKPNDKLPLECSTCKKVFYKTKHEIQRNLNPEQRIAQRRRGNYCSKECQSKKQIRRKNVNCLNCKVEFQKLLSQIKKTKNHFCSRSCSTTHNNIHKSHGTRRSKLEIWIEEQLSAMHFRFKIDYNQKDAINSELDIYVPSMNLAFELNGIFHYEPIFGQNKLEQIQNNDYKKLQACSKNSIELITIDASHMNYFKPKKAQMYLDIITEILKNKSKNNILTS